jgi:hypothetical protein
MECQPEKSGSQTAISIPQSSASRRFFSSGISEANRALKELSRLITTEYSRAELSNLIAAAEKACGENSHKIPTITWSAPLTPQEGRRNLLN